MKFPGAASAGMAGFFPLPSGFVGILSPTVMLMRLLFALLAFLCLAVSPALATGTPGVSPVITSTSKAQAPRKLGVLFIGNSYTHGNNMPRMLANIASSDAGSDVVLEIQSVTKAGGTLSAHWRDGRALAALKSRKWDYVVLQEQSLWALRPETVEETAEDMRRWVDEIKKTGAKPSLFVTWARQPGSFWYTDRKHAYLKSPQYMQEKLNRNSDALAEQLGLVTVRVGDAFAAAQAQNRKWPLFAADSSHPSPVGSYMAALILYQTLVRRSPEGTTHSPAGVSAEAAAQLRTIAASLPQK